MTSDTEIEVTTDKEKSKILLLKILIISAGSRPVQIPGIDYEDERIWDSTKALETYEYP